MKKYLSIAGWLALGFSIMCVIGYYHAQKRYTHPHYLAAQAAKRIELLNSKDKCFLLYRWEGGKQITYDVDASNIRSFADLPAVPEFATAQGIIIPLNDEVTQALLAGGLIASVKTSFGNAIKGGGNPKVKIGKIVIAVVGTITGYALGDVIYQRFNPPEYSEEMKTLLERQDFWKFLARSTWHRFSRQGTIPPQDEIRSKDILNAIASRQTTPRAIE